MKTWNFGEGRHEYSEVLNNTHRTFLFDSYGQKMWKIVIIANSMEYNQVWCQGYMECLRKSTLWSCYAEIEMQATNNNGVAFTGTKRRFLFNCFTKENRLSFTLTAGDCFFPDGNEGASSGETFNFVFNFRILSLVGVEKRPISDFSSSQNIDSEVTVLVGDQRLYADKYPMMSFSPLLREIINNGMNSNNEIEIKDAKVEDVVAFLRLLYHQKPPIKYKNVEGLMSLIIRYDAQCLIPVVEEELISTVQITPAEKNHISELYTFSDLKKVAMQQKVIEEQSEMEQQRRAQEMQRLAVKQKETSDMIRVFQQKVNEDKRYVAERNELASEKEFLEEWKKSMRKTEERAEKARLKRMA